MVISSLVFHVIEIDKVRNTVMDKSKCKMTFYAVLLVNGERSDFMNTMLVWRSEPLYLYY